MFTVVYTTDPAYEAAFGGLSAGLRSQFSMFDVPQHEEDEPIILISQNMANQLTQEDIAIIMLHEEGHIVLGHLEMGTPENTVIIGGCEVYTQESFELEADAYAAEHSSASQVIEMLERTSMIMINNVIATVAPEMQEEVRGILTAHINLQILPRIAALQALV